MTSPTSPSMLESAELACRRLGFGSLKPKQAEVLALLAKRVPTFAALPTGYGKSLCAWLPAEAWGWRVWVLSPLVSLIEDQALACEARGVPALAWVGGLSPARRAALAERMRQGGPRLVFLSPERFLRWQESGFFEALAQRGLDADLYVLDEMHCLEEWRGFREGYRNLAGPLRRQLQRGSSFLGLSASFSLQEARAWMAELLGDSRHAEVSAGLGRENLRLRVIAIEREEERWLGLISALRGLRAPESALVYCQSRAEADDVARWLGSAGFEATAYHAGLPGFLRSERSRNFRAGRLRIVCATSAFGMGIDYPNVSRVIHFSLPRDLGAYWQEVGRAGRSGAEACATAFWRRSEIVRARRMKEAERAAYFTLWLAWAQGGCRRAAVAAHFGYAEDPCGKCDRCVPRDSRTAWWATSPTFLSEWVRDQRGCGFKIEVK